MTYNVAGSIRFNTDSRKIEIYNGEQWWVVNSTSPDELTGGTRGVIAGGYAGTTPTMSNVIDFINIQATGNALDFGDLDVAKFDFPGQCSSRTRGVFGGGYQSGQPRLNTIEFVTIATKGDAQNFGDLTRKSNALVSFSNQIRGLWSGGYTPSVSNVIDYVALAHEGDAADFGDLSGVRRNQGSCASPTRGIMAGGYSPTQLNTIEYVTISTTGNAADFGDLTSTRQTPYGASNAIRGVFSNGYKTPSPNTGNITDFITIATLGNAADFGDLITTINHTVGLSSFTRMLFAGGYNSNTIQYKEFASTGNFLNFGDLTEQRGPGATASNSHGGLF
jgi:hypothetical protein|tara:strand:+ start:3082 stop:4083 length:1002 start_codon:yes stop_codon:yes gene_type:complete